MSYVKAYIKKNPDRDMFNDEWLVIYHYTSNSGKLIVDLSLRRTYSAARAYRDYIQERIRSRGDVALYESYSESMNHLEDYYPYMTYPNMHCKVK